MKKFLLIATLVVFTHAAHADAPKWTMLAEESKIAIKGKQMGKSFDGYFSDFSADIAFDPAHLEQSRVTVTINTNSLQTGDAERDETAKKSDWFDVPRYPNAVFTSTSFSKTDDTHFTAAGNLTIQGITAEITLPFTLNIQPAGEGHEKAMMTGEIELDRRKFELGTGEWADPSLIDPAVLVNITLAATR